jgi:hypothetical protein
MTLLEFYNILGNFKHKKNILISVCPSIGSQHIEEIKYIEFVSEVGRVLIFTKEK